MVQETQQTVQQQHAPHVQLAHTATAQQTHHVLHATSESTKTKQDKNHAKPVTLIHIRMRKDEHLVIRATHKQAANTPTVPGVRIQYLIVI